MDFYGVGISQFAGMPAMPIFRPKTGFSMVLLPEITHFYPKSQLG